MRIRCAHRGRRHDGQLAEDRQARPPTYKTDRDLANELDERTEREVKKLFARRTPDIPFLGKESSSVGPSGTYWCLDAIGRTLNFTQGIPMYATPLALVRDGVPNIGR